MSTRDIEDQMRDVYGIDISPTLVSKVPDKLSPTEKMSASRPPLHERAYCSFKIKFD